MLVASQSIYRSFRPMSSRSMVQLGCDRVPPTIYRVCFVAQSYSWSSDRHTTIRTIPHRDLVFQYVEINRRQHIHHFKGSRAFVVEGQWSKGQRFSNECGENESLWCGKTSRKESCEWKDWGRRSQGEETKRRGGDSVYVPIALA